MNLSPEMDWRDDDRIFSMDELSFCLNPHLNKIVSKRTINTNSLKNDKDCCTVLLGGK